MQNLILFLSVLFGNQTAGNRVIAIGNSYADNGAINDSICFSNSKLTITGDKNIAMFNSNNNGKKNSFSMFNTTASNDNEFALWGGKLKLDNLSTKKLSVVTTLPSIANMANNTIYILRG